MAFLVSSLVLILLTAIAVYVFKKRNTKPSQQVNTSLKTSYLGSQYPEADIQHRKTTFFLSGLLIALLFSIILVEYPTWISFELPDLEEVVTLEAQTISIPPTRIPPPRPPQPEPEPDVEILAPPEKIIEKEDEPEEEDEPKEEIKFETPPPPAPVTMPIIEDDGEEVSNVPIDATMVEEQPVFPGNLNAYIQKNLKISDRDIEEENFGVIFIQFVVDKDGSVSEVKLLRGINDRLNGSALNVMETMPKWQPGRQGGRPVRVRYNYPIRIEGR